MPSPEDLREYAEIIPSSPERFLQMVEREQVERIALRKAALNATIWEVRLGQIFGFVIALVGLIGSFILVMTGHPVTGSILGGSILLSLVTVFVKGRETKQDSVQPDEPEDSDSQD